MRYGGADITGRSPAKNVGAGIAFIPRGHGIFRSLSVPANLNLGGFLEADAGRLAERRELVYDLFPIPRDRAAQVGGTLSGGQQQMLAIGMALMHVKASLPSAHRVAVLKTGRKIYDGDPAPLRDHVRLMELF